MKKNRRQSHSLATEKQNLIPISCPDCFGVLSMVNEGPHDFSLYVCQINHRYSSHSLIEAKETQLEHLLWAAHVMLKQMIIAYEHALAKPNLISGADRASMRRRIHEVRKQCLSIRAMIEATHAVE